MANTINWGKIYESTAWGNTDNSISWGKSYADLAGGGPKNTSLPVISGTAERGQTLTSTTGTWTGTGTITYAYQWKRNGVDISGATASTYVLIAADDNASMTCVVSATDSEGTKSATSNVLGPVLGSPFLLSSPVASGTAQVGQTLSTTDGTWQGVAVITFAYQWRRDAVNISGATSSTYTLVAADYATDVDCVVTATNGLGSANADSNDLGPIAGTAPVISGVPTISTQTQVGETITATAASVTGVPTPTTSWQWQRSADGSTGWANISGATSSTYTLVAADDTNYVRAVQTETNAVGTDSANSAASAQIASGDADAQAFITAASITDSTQQTAINTLVTDLKTAGIWTKMKAIYPIVGGTASSHKFNLKDPRDLDAAFRLSFSSGWTHSSTGMVGNGTSTSSNPHFNPSVDASQNDAHASLYIRTDNDQSGVDFGTSNFSIQLYAGSLYTSLNASSYDSIGTYPSDGHFSISRISSTQSKTYVDGSLVSTQVANSIAPNNYNALIGAWNDGNLTKFPTNREYAFATLGEGLTDAEVSDLYTAIQAFQTTLGRQV